MVRRGDGDGAASEMGAGVPDLPRQGLGAQEVAALPRYHHQWLPDLIQAESGAFAPGTTQALRAMGHELKGGDEAGLGSSHRWGNLQTVEWDKRTGTLSTGSDPRNPVGAGRVELAPVP